MPYQEVFQLFVDIGLIDVILPFMLVFTIAFAILQNTKVLGEEDKKPKTRLNIMVAFVMGFFAVLATNLLNVISTILSYFVLLLISGLMIALVLGLAGAAEGTRNRFYIAIMALLLGVFVFYGLSQAGIIDVNKFYETILFPAIILGALIAALYFLMRPKEEKKEKKEKKGGPEKEKEKPGPYGTPQPAPVPKPGPYGSRRS